jgi:hypothetical protein
MKKNRIYRYPLRLDQTDKRSIEAVVRASGRTINQVLTLSLRKGLPLAKQALCPDAGRLTNIEPLPDAVWRRIYSRRDEVDKYTGEQLKAVQSQNEPQ